MVRSARVAAAQGCAVKCTGLDPARLARARELAQSARTGYFDPMSLARAIECLALAFDELAAALEGAREAATALDVRLPPEDDDAGGGS